MTSIQLKDLDLKRGDECEVRDESAIKHNSVCFVIFGSARCTKHRAPFFTLTGLPATSPKRRTTTGNSGAVMAFSIVETWFSWAKFNVSLPSDSQAQPISLEDTWRDRQYTDGHPRSDA